MRVGNWFAKTRKEDISKYNLSILMLITNTVNLCTTTTLGTSNLWPLLTSGRCSEVAMCYKYWNETPKWRSLFASGRYSEVVVNLGLTVLWSYFNFLVKILKKALITTFILNFSLFPSFLCISFNIAILHVQNPFVCKCNTQVAEVLNSFNLNTNIFSPSVLQQIDFSGSNYFM